MKKYLALTVLLSLGLFLAQVRIPGPGGQLPSGGGTTPAYISGCSVTVYGTTLNCTISSVTSGQEIAVGIYIGNSATVTMSDICNTGGITDVYTSQSSGSAFLRRAGR